MDVDIVLHPRIFSWMDSWSDDGYGYGYGFGRPVQTRSVAILSTCRGRPGAGDGGSSRSAPVRRLKLTSRTAMLRDDTNSATGERVAGEGKELQGGEIAQGH